MVGISFFFLIFFQIKIVLQWSTSGDLLWLEQTSKRRRKQDEFKLWNKKNVTAMIYLNRERERELIVMR